eukprot:jgi/Undpi1/4801/HiC_scaffold_19.g08154.m1
MPGKGFTPGALPESGAGLGVSQVSAGPLRAPIPGSIPVVNKDAEQQKQDQQDEEGRSQRGSTGGSENDGEAGYGTAQASMPRNFRISLEGYSLQKDDDGTFAAYRINVTAGLHTWHVLRRYRQFLSLHSALSEHVKAEDMPHLPGKRILGSSVDPSFAEARGLALQVR